ncbi:MAK10-like protein [Tanacetum coccineum]
MGDENPIRTLRDYSKPSHKGYRNTIQLPVGNNVVTLRSDTIRLVQNGCSFHGHRSEDPNQHLKDFLKLVDSLDLDASWRISIRSMDSFQGLTPKSPSLWHRPLAPKDLALYDNESWNDPRDFAKPVNAIALPQDVPSTSDRRLIELETHVQRLMEAHLALTQPTQVNKITTSCEICSGPHDTQYCMENPEQAFVDYASLLTDEAGEGLVFEFMASQDTRLSKFEAEFKRQQGEMTNKIDTVLKAITDQITGTLPSDTVKNPKLGTHPVSTKENEEEEKGSPKNNPDSSTPPDPSISFITEKVLKFNSLFESLGLVPPSPNTELVCTKEEDGDVMFIEIISKDDNSHREGPEARVKEVEYFNTFPTRSELAYHKYLMCGQIPSIFLRNPIIIEGCPSNLKIPCNIGHVHVEKAYIDLNSPLNIMTRMMYNWIMKRKLDPRENANGGISNFTRRIKRMHVFIGNFTYVVDFMIAEDISSIIDLRLSQVLLGRPFIKISNMTHDLPEGVVRFTNENDKVSYKMPYKIEQYNSLSDLEKEHTKSVYLRNKEDKRRGFDYVMSKILGFYKECLELGPEYLTGLDDEGEVT